MRGYNEIYELLKSYNQEHLLNFYDELSDTEKHSLLEQIESIDFELMKKLYNTRNEHVDANKEIKSFPYVVADELSFDEKKKYINAGIEIIKAGKVAVCQLAGGQGTRLGFDGPKGTYIVNVTPPKSIFEIFADKIKKTYSDYGVKVKWYIMTSNANDEATKKFFKENNYFEYGEENISFFKQSELPLLDAEGDLILSDKGKVFMAANGNGGVYEALKSNGILDELDRLKIEYLGIGNVDNILLDILDPLYIGMMANGGYDLALKTIPKTSPNERVGVVCKIDNKPGVVEYTEISEEMANMRDENGKLIYNEAYYGIAVFATELLKKIEKGLTYHIAFKKNSYIDKGGRYMAADTPNTYKFEMFIFDGFSFSENMLDLSVKREENFAPIKNKVGEDSPETAIKLYNDFYCLD